MGFPILTNWKIPLPILGMPGIFIHFYFIHFLIEIPVSKQWRVWSDAVFCRIWFQSAVFAYIPLKGGLTLVSAYIWAADCWSHMY